MEFSSLRRCAWLLFLPLSISGFCYAQSAKKVVPSGARVERVEQTAIELPATAGKEPLRMSLAELYEELQRAGLSLAVIENYKIVDVKAYGVIQPDSSTPVTRRTLFQAGSISKPVAATAALWLMEKQMAVDVWKTK